MKLFGCDYNHHLNQCYSVFVVVSWFVHKREAKKTTLKAAVPVCLARQVIDDLARFGHHFTESFANHIVRKLCRWNRMFIAIVTKNVHSPFSKLRLRFDRNGATGDSNDQKQCNWCAQHSLIFNISLFLSFIYQYCNYRAFEAIFFSTSSLFSVSQIKFSVSFFMHWFLHLFYLNLLNHF